MRSFEPDVAYVIGIQAIPVVITLLAVAVLQQQFIGPTKRKQMYHTKWLNGKGKETICCCWLLAMNVIDTSLCMRSSLASSGKIFHQRGKGKKGQVPKRH
jgi:hypothetical protein